MYTFNIVLFIVLICINSISSSYYQNDLLYMKSLVSDIDDGQEQQIDVSVFKIVQITDIHFGEGESYEWGPEQDKNSTRVMETIIKLENPDLVVFTGDLITGNNIIDNATSYWKEALSVVLKHHIAWAIVFGNHDDLASGQDGSRVDLMNYDISLGSYSEFGDSSIPGVSNYYLPIYDKWTNNISIVLWMFDSGDGSCSQPTFNYNGYLDNPYKNDVYQCNTYITKEQVEWYLNTSKQLYINDSTTDDMPLGLSFFHIPLQEYMEVWNQETCYGTNNDSVACQPVNAGLFEAFQQVGDVKFVSVGHNHGNDYCGSLNDIQLCYGRHSGYGGYGAWEKGARVIEIKKPKNGKPTLTTWLRYETGQKVISQPIHYPNTTNPQTSCFNL